MGKDASRVSGGTGFVTALQAPVAVKKLEPRQRRHHSRPSLFSSGQLYPKARVGLLFQQHQADQS